MALAFEPGRIDSAHSAFRPLSANEIDRLVARRIRAARIECGITLEDAAPNIGVTPQQLSNCEHSLSRVHVGKLAVLARIYSKPIGWFFGGAETAGA